MKFFLQILTEIQRFTTFLKGIGMKVMLLLFINIFLLQSYAFTLERFDIVTTETLKNMLDQRERGDSQFLLINTLDKIIADHLTIPGSINIPWSKVRDQAQLLGKDKNIPIITYCMGYR